MSKIRLTVSRLLALGGFTAVSGTSYALYKYSLLGNSSAVDCKGVTFGKKDREPLLESQVKWDDDWDSRKGQVKEVVNVEKKLPPLSDPNNGSVVAEELNDKVRATATRHVILVRHGQYISGNTDEKRVLSEIGRKQASFTADRLKSLDIPYNKVVISTMTRAKETGSIICDRLPDVPTDYCSLLREGAPYPPEPISKSWNPDRWTFFQDNPRIEGAFRKYIHRADPSQKEDSHDVLVCHGNVIRYFVCRALQFPPEGWLRMSTGNCGVTWLTIRPNGRVSLRGFGDVGHLPPELITFN